MPLSLSNYSGDGQTVNMLDVDVTLPDSGTTIAITGKVQAVGQSIVLITGSPVTFNIPGSGTNFYIVECNTTTGALTVLLSTASFAAITLDPGNVEVYRMSFASTANPDEALDASTASTPDSW